MFETKRVMVSSKTIQLRSINVISVLTLGQTTLELVVNGVIMSSQFDIVSNEFPITTDDREYMVKRL